MQHPLPTMLVGGNKVGMRTIFIKLFFSMNAGRQNEQATLDRDQVAVAEATVEVQTDMLQEFFRTEQFCENTVTSEQMESLHQTKNLCHAIAEK